MTMHTRSDVYVEELRNQEHSITAVDTSITAFVGRARRGPLNQPVAVHSFAGFAKIFGGLWRPSTMSHAVQHYFDHGGGKALIVRVFAGDAAASTAVLRLPAERSALELEAADPGEWGEALRATVDHDGVTGAHRFNLLIEERGEAGQVVAAEWYRDLSTDPDHARFATKVLAEESALVRVRQMGVDRPAEGTAHAMQTASDGEDLTSQDLLGNEQSRTGIYALEKADLFNLLCLPPPTPGGEASDDVDPGTLGAAARYCQQRRALLIVDSPAAWTARPSHSVAAAQAGIESLRAAMGKAARNAAVYFPRIQLPDALDGDRPASFAPCGAIAGIMALTDRLRGVWKAPAGIWARFPRAEGFDYSMTDAQNGRLSPLGINCLRSFPAGGHLVWGARTAESDDTLGAVWKYLPVRRLAMFMEESLHRGLRWAAFEVNDEALWARIRHDVSVFMQGLFRQGAFQGARMDDAFFVKCDEETTSRSDSAQSIINVFVGFAPLKPAEFVVLKLQLAAADTCR